jgi:hypothetical protein
MTRPRLANGDVSRAHPGGDAFFRHGRLSRMRRTSPQVADLGLGLRYR